MHHVIAAAAAAGAAAVTSVETVKLIACLILSMQAAVAKEGEDKDGGD